MYITLFSVIRLGRGEGGHLNIALRPKVIIERAHRGGEVQLMAVFVIRSGPLKDAMTINRGPRG